MRIAFKICKQWLLALPRARKYKKATRTAINVFRQYLEAKYLKEDDILASKETFVNVLRKFYAKARKRDGEFYSN